MKKQCELQDRECIQNKIAGLGERSFRKSYYPELQKIERFKALLDQSNDAIFLLGVPDGRFVDVNQSACVQLGYDCGDVLKMTIYDILCDSADAIKGILSGNVSSIVLTATLRCREGREIPYEINARKVCFGGITYSIAVARNIEERVRIERTLRESEEKFRVLAETSTAVIYVYQDENLVYVNDAAKRVTGYSKDELLKMKFWDIVHPDYREMVRERGLARQRGGPVPSPYEIRFITKGGEARWAELSAGQIMFMGKPAGVATFFDITERKRAEEEIAKLAFIVMSSDEAIIGKRLDGIITSWNPGAEKIYGYTAAEIIGRSISIIIPPERPDELDMILGKIISGEHIGDYETERVAKDGRRINVSVTISPVRDRSGKIIGASAITRDITERKHAEVALRKLSRVVEESPSTVVITDVNGDIEYVNRKFTELTGYTFEEVKGKNPSILKSGHTPPEEYRLMWETILSGKEWRGEFLNRKKDGGLYWESSIIFPIADTCGKITNLIAVKEDITERKQAVEALADAKALAELYVDLMSHDINNQNQVALGYLEMADDVIASGGRLGEGNRALIKKPIESLNSSSRLIDKVMKLRKLKTRELRLEQVDICQVLSGMKDRYTQASGQNITINYMPPRECLVVANELIDEIFTNLIENAMKHSHKDRPLVIDVLQAEVCEGGKTYFRISIEDNGPGIPDEIKDKLFARYFKGKAGTKGKGLGLFLVKTLVEDFKGKVWVEDRVPGDHAQGAKFVVMLPTTPQDTQSSNKNHGTAQ